MRNIILTGFMGSGKTSVGKLLASRAGHRFVDIDALIVERENRTINDIFTQEGEAYFRKVETELLEKALMGNNLVVSTGGGAVISERNRELMKGAGIVVNLTASAEDILERLSGENERPLLREGKGLEKIRQMLNERERYYADADIRIDTTGKNVEDVVREILAIIERGA